MSNAKTVEDFKISDMHDLKRVAAETGNHFFSPGAMRFFNCRVSGSLWLIDDRSGFFVTSEKDDSPYQPEQPRLYTVRRYRVTTMHMREQPWLEIETVGEFQQWETLAEAKRAAYSHWRNDAYIN